MMPHRILVFLCVALWAGSPSTASAQRSAAPGDTKVYACVDPTDALARRRFQDEPCTLPMYHLPAAGAFSESPRLPEYRAPGEKGVHPMFWRFPVQPMGPVEVPRHSRR